MKRIIFFFLPSAFLCFHTGFAQHTIQIKHTYYTNLFDTVQCSEIEGYYVQTAEHAAAAKAHPIKRSSFTNDPDAPDCCHVPYANCYSTYNKQYPKTDLQDRLDKGHVNPYEAFEFDQTAAKESMYYTNVCPQISHFNEQQWKNVEAYVLKKICVKYGDVKVWTGVLISTSHPRMAGNLFIPDFYWKVIEYQKDNQTAQEAWLGPNKSTNTGSSPDSISTTVPDLKRVIRQYYPAFTFDF